MLRPAPRAAVVLELALDMFRPRERLAHQIQVLGRLAERTMVYELTYDDLDEAAAGVRDLLEQPSGEFAHPARPEMGG